MYDLYPFIPIWYQSVSVPLSFGVQRLFRVLILNLLLTNSTPRRWTTDSFEVTQPVDWPSRSYISEFCTYRTWFNADWKVGIIVLYYKFCKYKLNCYIDIRYSKMGGCIKNEKRAKRHRCVHPHLTRMEDRWRQPSHYTWS